MPFKIGQFYKSVFTIGVAIRILGYTRRDTHTVELKVDWYRHDENLNKWINMNLESDIVENIENFANDWKPLAL